MFTHSRRLMHTAMGFLLACAFNGSLQAQLDPRLQNSKSDFLDLYQQSNNLSVKPEIVTIFDFTGSMAAGMFHHDYINKDLSDSAGNDAGLSFYLVDKGGGRYDVKAFMGVTGSSRTLSGAMTNATNLPPATFTMTLNNTTTAFPNATVALPRTIIIDSEAFTYTGKSGNTLTGVTRAQKGTVAAAHAAGANVYYVDLDATGGTYYTGSPAVSMDLSGGTLVRPDGSQLSYANASDTAINTNYSATDPYEPVGGIASLPGEPTTPKATDVRNWIRSASHVRFTWDGKTFDVPIGWNILDSPTVVRNVVNGEYRQMYAGATNYPLRMTLLDPKSNTEIEMDRSYRVAASSIFTTGSTGTASTSCTISSSFFGHRPIHYYWIWYGLTGNPSTVPQATAATGYAFANGIPGRNRSQAIKDATMRVWAKYYNKVFWAYRFINDQNGATGHKEQDGFVINSDSNNDMSNSNFLTTNIYGGTQRRWILMNGDPTIAYTSADALRRLSSYYPSGSTPLNYGMVNTLAQYNDPNSVFTHVETGVDRPVECRPSFLMLFTDGFPNTETGNPSSTVSPYYWTDPHGSGQLVGEMWTGNSKVAANQAGNCMDPGVTVSGQSSQWFNVISLAAIAAHGGDTTPYDTAHPPSQSPAVPANPTHIPQATYPGASTWYSSGNQTHTNAFLPFYLQQRGSVLFKSPGHAITTYTVGVSLGGTINDANGGKRRLFFAAAVGDPLAKTWNLSTMTPFTLVDINHPELGKTTNSANFFDATDPTALTTSLDAAFQQAAATSNLNATANPNVPFIGASFGTQIYLGSFQPPAHGGVMWPGDLLMFATKESNGSITMINQNADPVSAVDAANAGWSALDILKNTRLWSARLLYTRLPNATEPGPLQRFSDIDSLPSPDNNAFSNIRTSVATVYGTDPLHTHDNDRKALIQYVSGADKSSVAVGGRYTANRTNIMGDVIDSAPTAIEYNWNDVKTSLTTRLQGAVASGNTTDPWHFRLVLVGTNQGWLHAFGEVTQQIQKQDSGGDWQTLTKGGADELWSFLPTDFLANMDYLDQSNNPHRFLVDGSPLIYHLDRPAAAGGLGNGVVDISGTTPERTVAIFGLNKGGRSYYALDVHDPFHPTLRWSLVPDEAASFPASRIPVSPGAPNLATVQNVLGSMGFSTCTPTFGRITFNGIYRDAVFFGGGYSNADTDTKFPGQKLGRSILALDVWTGEVLAAVDMTAASLGGSNMSPIDRGLVPFEFFLGSGMAQRAYFLDTRGGMWSWGSKALASGGIYNKNRLDSSDLAQWTTTGVAGDPPGVRKVYQDTSGGLDASNHYRDAIYSTLPAPFLVGSFSGKGKTAGSATPAAVGIAIESGERHNPLDYLVGYTALPVQHRLTMIFDRQDSNAWGFDTQTGPDTGMTTNNLIDFTGNSVSTNPTNACTDLVFKRITPGCADYYLAPQTGNPYFGYYVNFPQQSLGSDGQMHVPKGITSPMVVSGTLFYSYFSPLNADPCTGGSGTTYTSMICDAINPIVTDTRTNIACASGIVDQWIGVGSEFMMVGTSGVMQAGAVTAPVVINGSTTTIESHEYLGNPLSRYPRARVWRTVY
jgi:hypothetical protein